MSSSSSSSQEMDQLDGTHLIPQEVLRLMGATLQRMGLHRTVAALEVESGVSVNSPELESLRNLLLDGKWEESLRMLDGIQLTPIERKKVLSAVTEQEYREIVQERTPDKDLNHAAGLLRRIEINEIVAQGIVASMESHRKLRNLASMLLFPPQNAPSRYDLLSDIEKALKPGEFVANRLINLLEDILSNQNMACRYHNSIQQKQSLFGDHSCNMDENLPSTIQHHTGTIHYLQFSSSGRYLASFGSDSTIIWRIHDDTYLLYDRKFAKLEEETANANENPMMGYFCWSPDERELLITRHGMLKMWSINGTCVGRFPGTDSATCCWTLDKSGNSRIFTYNNDGSICMWHRFRHLKTWGDKRISLLPQLCVKDKQELVFVSGINKISIFDWEKEEEVVLSENRMICSFSLSRDSKTLLVSLIDRTVALWKVDGRPKKLKLFYDSEVSTFSPDVCFGGLEEGFFATANNDQVHIWNRSSSKLIIILKGHTARVECIAWNPNVPTMLVSGGEKLQVWGMAICSSSIW